MPPKTDVISDVSYDVVEPTRATQDFEKKKLVENDGPNMTSLRRPTR